MNVWRKQTTRWTLNGKRAKAGTPNAKRHVEGSKRFYGTLRDAYGKRKQVPLTEDEETSRTMLKRLQRDADALRASGVPKHVIEAKRPLDDHLNAYKAYLRSKGNTADYVALCESRLRKVLSATKTTTLGELDGERIAATLATWRTRNRKPIGIGTSNHYVTAIKALSRWAWRERKLPDDPLAGLRKQNAETDRKRVRRPLTPTELETLTREAQQSKRTYRGDDWQFTPTDRAMLYVVAAYTGLRAKECAALSKSSFDFEAMTWTLPATATKNGKACTLPLSPALATKLQSWFVRLNREALFPGSWTTNNRRMAGKLLQRDLKRAGIAYVDDTGRCVDFHALRHTFITSLAKAGVHPAKAQRLARHSTITLTMDVYTSLDVDDLRDAIGAI